MTIPTSAFVTVKQAAAALGVEKEAIEQRLEDGRLRGKKERVLSKDVWFIYKDELNGLLDKREQRLFGDAQQNSFLDQIDFDPALLPQVIAEEDDLPLKEQFSLSLRLMSEEFSRCMQSSLHHIHELQEQLKESEAKLLLLDDMEKRVAEDRQLVEDKDAALTAAHERISSLQEEVQQLTRPWWKKLLG